MVLIMRIYFIMVNLIKEKKYYGIEINDIGGFRGYFYANGNYYKGK